MEQISLSPHSLSPADIVRGRYKVQKGQETELDWLKPSHDSLRRDVEKTRERGRDKRCPFI